jgi:hypothetical protein
VDQRTGVGKDCETPDAQLTAVVVTVYSHFQRCRSAKGLTKAQWHRSSLDLQPLTSLDLHRTWSTVVRIIQESANECFRPFCSFVLLTLFLRPR